MSKYQLQRELPLAPFIRRDCHAAHVAVIQEVDRNLKVRVVERVERFGAELQPQSFSQLEILQQRQIHAAKTWADQDVAPGIAEDIRVLRRGNWAPERPRIEIQAVGDVRVRIADQIGPLLRNVGRVVLRRERASREQRQYAVQLPAAYQSLGQSAR